MSDLIEWTPEQRVAVALVEILRMKRAIKYPPLPTVTRSGQAIPLRLLIPLRVANLLR